jgi:hypothetical protein
MTKIQIVKALRDAAYALHQLDENFVDDHCEDYTIPLGSELDRLANLVMSTKKSIRSEHVELQ